MFVFRADAGEAILLPSGGLKQGEGTVASDRGWGNDGWGSNWSSRFGVVWPGVRSSRPGGKEELSISPDVRESARRLGLLGCSFSCRAESYLFWVGWVSAPNEVEKSSFQPSVTYGLWALNREVNHKVDTLAGGCLAVERDEGGGRVERGSTGGT